MSEIKKIVIAVLAGDGIGPEIMMPCLELLKLVLRGVPDVVCEFKEVSAGADYYRSSGLALSEEDFECCLNADAILLGAMGLPDIRYPDGTEISPQLELRERLGLYAGVRPIKSIKGLAYQTLKDDRASNIDFILVRESIEGLFAERTKLQASEDCASDKLVITRKGASQVCDFAFRLAEKRKQQGFGGVLTCVDKANVLGSLAFFRKIFFERAADFDIETQAIYVDAAAQALVMSPWQFDVLVTENMFGDILSELGAGLIGGVGFAPSADIGDKHAVFQPCHGSAPNIAGQGIANPSAMFLSAALMLDWLAEQHDLPSLASAAAVLREATYGAFEHSVLLPAELGGTATTDDIYRAVVEGLN